MQSLQKILLDFKPENKNLLPALKKISAVFGYISQKDAEIIADYFSISLAQVFETASFFDQIKTKKTADIFIQVCSSANCAVAGAFSLVSEIENMFRIKAGEDNNLKVQLEEVSCLGRCGEGPVMIVNGKVFTEVTKNKIHSILEGYL